MIDKEKHYILSCVKEGSVPLCKVVEDSLGPCGKVREYARISNLTSDMKDINDGYEYYV